MPAKLIMLPSKTFEHTRLIKIPEHYDGHEAFRHTTGLIAGVEEANPNCTWEDIAEALEEQGFEVVNYIMGPELD